MRAPEFSPAPDSNTSIRKLNSLRASHVEATRLALRSFAADWALDQHDDCDGELMLVLTPPGPEAVTPSFVLSGSPAHVQLAVTHRDVYNPLGTFQTIPAAVSRIQETMRTDAALSLVNAA